MSKRKKPTESNVKVSTDEDAEEAPSHLICPITRMMFKEPVIVTTKTCARTYERSAILDWIVRGNFIDPLSRERLIDLYLTPNESIRLAVSNWLDLHPGLTPEAWSSRDLPPRTTRCRADIHNLATQGDIRGVEICIKAGIEADRETFDSNKYSPLHFATLRGHSDLVNFLINDGKANVNARTADKNTAMHLAAAAHDNMDMIRTLINAGGDVNSKNIKWNTPLHIAARADHVMVALHLIRSGANPNTVSKDNGTPLHIAVKHNNIDTVDVLLQHADITRTDRQYSTCLHVAVENGHFDVVKTLIGCERSCELEVNRKNNRGLTAIHMATIQDDVDIVKALLDHEKIDADILSDDGLTALHMAITGRNIKITKALMLSQKSEMGITGKKTLLHWVFACANIREGMRDFELFDPAFLKGFIDLYVYKNLLSTAQLVSWINYKNEDGKTALDLCLELTNFHGRELGMPCIELLQQYV